MILYIRSSHLQNLSPNAMRYSLNKSSVFKDLGDSFMIEKDREYAILIF